MGHPVAVNVLGPPIAFIAKKSTDVLRRNVNTLRAAQTLSFFNIPPGNFSTLVNKDREILVYSLVLTMYKKQSNFDPYIWI